MLEKAQINFKKVIPALAVLLFFAIFSHAAKADVLGQDQNFSISSTYDLQSRNSITATLKSVTEHAYFYVEDNYWNSASSTMQDQIINQINTLASEFNLRIYPTETQFFGAIRDAGDGKVTVLLSPLVQEAGGYYDTANEYTKEQVAASNAREMVYLNISQLSDQRKMDSFLAHELQHLITFNQKNILRNVNDDTWLNELRSEYAVTLLGYNDIFDGSNLSYRLNSFLNDPGDSLTEWKNLPADYAEIDMFGEYVAEHWSPNVIADTIKSPFTGIASLEDALAKNGFKDSFKDVFNSWLAANFLNDTSLNSKFGYSRGGMTNFHIVPSRVLNNLTDDVTFVVSDSIKDWQGRWYDISQFSPGKNNFLRINFSSPSLASFHVPYIVFKTDGSMTMGTFNPDSNANVLYLGQIGVDINRVLLMPVKQDKISGFGASETPVTLTFTVDRTASMSQSTLVTPTSLPTPVVPMTTITNPGPFLTDGSLVRARGDSKVYLIMGKWKRHIISSKIFGFYKQFGFDKVQEVEPSVLTNYQESNLVRYGSSSKVYIVDESGNKHWLNITYKQFVLSGRSADSIFPINLAEFNFYRTSFNVTK